MVWSAYLSKFSQSIQILQYLSSKFESDTVAFKIDIFRLLDDIYFHVNKLMTRLANPNPKR